MGLEIREYKQKEESGREGGATGEQGEEDIRDQSPRHPASHRITGKIKYTEIRKLKSTEAKSSCNNLRKADKTQAKLSPPPKPKE